jgi:hypothetical protein
MTAASMGSAFSVTVEPMRLKKRSEPQSQPRVPRLARLLALALQPGPAGARHPGRDSLSALGSIGPRSHHAEPPAADRSHSKLGKTTRSLASPQAEVAAEPGAAGLMKQEADTARGVAQETTLLHDAVSAQTH